MGKTRNGIGFGYRTGMASKGSLLNYDANAKAFINAAGITDATQKLAINTFVKDLKAINETLPNFVNFDTPSDSILKACYPLIGGSATSHKFNLINPADSDAAYRAAWVNAVTHSANGIQGNNSNQALNSYLNPATVMAANSGGLDVFLSNDINRTGTHHEAGVFQYDNPNYYRFAVSPWTGQLRASAWYKEISLTQASDAVIACGNGITNLNILSSDVGGVKLYRNNVNVGTNTGAASLSVPSGNIYACGANGPGTAYTDNIISYFGIRSSGVAESILVAYNNAIIKLQVNLGRCSLKNVFSEGHSMIITEGSTTSRLNYLLISGLNSTFANRTMDNYCFGVYGSTVANLVSRYASGIKLKVRSGFKNFMPLWIGINEIATGGYAGGMAALWAAVKSYTQTAINDGFTPILITATKASSVTGDKETDRQSFNTLMKTDYPSGSYVIDVTTHSEFDDPTNTTYFADGLHMTVAGRQIVANDLIALINTL